MLDQFPAVFRDGAFYPTTPCDLPNESLVMLKIQEPAVRPPLESDPEKRRQIMERLIERMENNPLPANAPPMTREWLHERR